MSSPRPVFRSIAILLAAGVVLCAGIAGAAPADLTASNPQREADFIAIFDKAQKLYTAAKSDQARQDARIGMQIDLHEFLGLAHRADGWVGTFHRGDTSQDGNRSIEIEIAPGVLISTWTNDYDEGILETMIRPFSPLAPVLKDLTIGEPVRFSASLIGSVVSTDEDMVLRPRLIAQFDRLEKLPETTK